MVSAAGGRNPKGKATKLKQKKPNSNGNVNKEIEVMEQDSKLQSLPKTKRNVKEMAEQSETPQKKQVSEKESIAKKPLAKRKAMKDLQEEDTKTRSIKKGKKKKMAETEDQTTATGTEDKKMADVEDNTTATGTEDSAIQEDTKIDNVIPNAENASKRNRRKDKKTKTKKKKTAAKKQQSEKETPSNKELVNLTYKENKMMTCVDNIWMLRTHVAKYKSAVTDIEKLPQKQKNSRLKVLRATMHGRLNKKLLILSRREEQKIKKKQKRRQAKMKKSQNKIVEVEKVETPTTITLKKEDKPSLVVTGKKGLTDRIIPNIEFKENKLMTQFEGVWVRRNVAKSLGESRAFMTRRILNSRSKARQNDPLSEAQQKKVDDRMTRRKKLEAKKLMKILKTNAKKKSRSKRFNIPCIDQKNAAKILKKGKKSMGVINPVIKSFAKRVGDKKATIKLMKLQGTMMRNRVQPTEEKRRLLIASKQEERIILQKKAKEHNKVPGETV